MSIKTFTHKGVEEVFRTGRSRNIGTEFHKRMSLMLDAIDGATCASDLRGARGFHVLRAIDPGPSRCRLAVTAADLPLRTRR